MAEQAETADAKASDKHPSTNTWAEWAGEHECGPYSLGVEEEVMLIERGGWGLAYRRDVLTGRPRPRRAAEPRDAWSHHRVRDRHPGGQGGGESAAVRPGWSGARPSGAGRRIGHAPDRDVARRRVSPATLPLRYTAMRELARREPTFALHVHVARPRCRDRDRVANRMRVHLPLLLALSANSPFWQGRDSGLASTRTPIFGLPTRGHPAGVQCLRRVRRRRAHADPHRRDPRADLPLVGRAPAARASARSRCGSWTPRPSPGGRAPVTLIQSLCSLEAEGERTRRSLHEAPALEENRFLACRDGVSAPDPARRGPPRLGHRADQRAG